jgi:DNA gyrase subunit B
VGHPETNYFGRIRGRATRLLQVKLEDIAETEAIFTTLMGEDVEARRKFIEDNALDVKNLDI